MGWVFESEYPRIHSQHIQTPKCPGSLDPSSTDLPQVVHSPLENVQHKNLHVHDPHPREESPDPMDCIFCLKLG